MHITYDSAKNTLKAVEGVTVNAEINISGFADNRDETFDEAMLRSLNELQRQLDAHGVSDAMIDATVERAVPMLAELIRKTKNKTACYREYTFPH